jgi:hypothetical protein
MEISTAVSTFNAVNRRGAREQSMHACKRDDEMRSAAQDSERRVNALRSGCRVMGDRLGAH